MKNSLITVFKFLVTISSFVSIYTECYGQVIQGFEAQIGIEVPFDYQIRGKINLPERWYSTVGLGMNPKFLTGSYESLSSGMGIHGEKTASLVDTAIGNNFYLDIRLGYEFSSNENGMYVDFGYSYSGGKGSSTTMDEVEGALGVDFLGVAQNSELEVSSTLHNLTVHMGYSWRLTNSWILYAEGGIIKPISSSTTVTFSNFISPATEQQIDSEVDSHMSDVYSGEMFVPTFSLWASYLF